ncbi:MAG TPA: serine hydrolase domain-containing protein [Acidobacteriota bacterium]|nr:serine hydrolase domain-containing protein [Acidobacteriota bacterium]
MGKAIMLGWMAAWAWLGGVQAAEERADLAAKLEKSLDALGDFGFSGTVLVAVDGDVLLHRGYGLARRGPEVKMQPETRFPVASISKQFTAAAILTLEEDGKLRTPESIGRYLQGIPDDKAAITIGQLLTHTSGLPFECGGRPASMEALLQCLWATPLQEAGKVQYSNAGYAVLAHLVEKVSGRSFREYVRKRLFQPSQMAKTGFIDEPDRFAQGQVAHQYTWTVEHGTEIDSQMNWNLRGSADVVTTAGDLFGWEQALSGGKILEPGAVKRLLRGDGEAGTAKGSGYGWQTDRAGQVQKAAGTFGLGFNAVFRRYPRKGAVLAVLSNQNYGLLMPTPLVAETAENILMGHPAIELPQTAVVSEDLQRQCAGSYELPGQGQLEVEAHSGSLVISAQGQPSVDLLTARTKPEARRLRGYTERAQKLAQALEKGRFGEIAQILEAADPSRIENLYRGWIEGLEREQGKLESAEVAGTIPQGESARTYLLLNFQEGRKVRRLRWLGDDLVSILAGGLPLVPTRFRLLSKDKLVGFHLAYARTVEVRIVRDGQGVISGLEFEGPEGKVVARKR